MDVSSESEDRKELLQQECTEKDQNDEEFRLYRVRWYILFQFSLLSFTQTAIASTWSPISLSAAQALHLTKHDFDLLANWAVMGLMIFLPLDIWLLNRFGLRPAVLFGATSVLIGSGLRCISIPHHQKILVHIGQMFNGIGGCPVMGCAPFLSNTWFPFRDRVLATGIMLLGGSLGSVFSSLLGPFLVEQPNNTTDTNSTDNTQIIKHQISTYMIIELGVALFTIILMVTYFPNKPSTPPSQSAATKRTTFLVGIKALSRNLTYWAVVILYVGVIGGNYGWMGIAAVLFESKGISQKNMGLLMTVANGLGVVVGIFVSWSADRLKSHRSYLWVLTNLTAYVATLYVVAISLNWIHVQPFLFTSENLWISMIVLNIAVSAIQPLAFEMWADTAYPIDEGTATSIPVWLSMLLMVVYLTTLSRLKNQALAFYFMLGLLTAAMPFLYFSLKKGNTRMELDLRQS